MITILNNSVNSGLAWPQFIAYFATRKTPMFPTSATELLTSLASGDEAIIVAVHAEEALHHRLTAMGFRVGRPLRIMRRGAFLGPLHVRVGSTDVIIRRRDAQNIEVTRVAES